MVRSTRDSDCWPQSFREVKWGPWKEGMTPSTVISISKAAAEKGRWRENGSLRKGVWKDLVSHCTGPRCPAGLSNNRNQLNDWKEPEVTRGKI